MTKMTDEDVAYCLRCARECGAPESARKLEAHIAALTAEQTAEREAAGVAADAATALIAQLRGERNALRERVRALREERDMYRRDFEAELSGAASLRKEYGAREGETFFAFVGRLASDSSRLAAIRQRAHTYFAGKAPSPAYVTVESRVAFLMGDDAPAPSEMDGLRGEMAEAPVFNEGPDTITEAGRKMAEEVAPTTAEAFATLTGFMWADVLSEGEQERGRAALSLLERRMGAQEAAARALIAGAREGRVIVADVNALESALTDAPPVFTLEEKDVNALSAGAAFLRTLHNHIHHRLEESNKDGLRYWAEKLQKMADALRR